MESSDDYEFKSAFDKMVNDSFQGRLTEAMKVDIAIPMHLKGMYKNCKFPSKMYRILHT